MHSCGTGIFGGDPCACGEPVANCPLWQDVMNGWSITGDAASLNRYSDLVDRVDSVHFSNRKLAIADQEFFQTQTALLYQSIARVTGATVLIESSKSPNRLRHLLGVPGVSVRAIHLIRDVASVARSMARSWQAAPSAGISHDLSREVGAADSSCVAHTQCDGGSCLSQPRSECHACPHGAVVDNAK